MSSCRGSFLFKWTCCILSRSTPVWCMAWQSHSNDPEHVAGFLSGIWRWNWMDRHRAGRSFLAGTGLTEKAMELCHGTEWRTAKQCTRSRAAQLSINAHSNRVGPCLRFSPDCWSKFIGGKSWTGSVCHCHGKSVLTGYEFGFNGGKTY